MQWPGGEDLDSLPPAVRRKFFSNVERLRIRLAQSDPSSPARSGSTPDYYYGRTRPTRRGPSPPHLRTLRNASTTSLTRRRGLERRAWASPQKLRKHDSLQLAYLIAQADSQCFHALPAKIQQKLFSPEERLRLRLAYRDSVILDAADEAYRRDTSARKRRPSTDSSISEDTLPVGQLSTGFWDSDSESDWEEIETKMNQSFYDSFQLLDGDGDLDLSLDEYHAHVADAAIRKPKPRRRPSFRRSLSFSANTSLKHRPSASVPQGLPSSQSAFPLAPIINRSSASRPGSCQNSSHHAPQASTASIDPAAQYYQDPDARLKLRVYLASPQKFDEAIEFGFPALGQDNENVATDPVPVSPQSTLVNPDCAGTFFEDDDGTMVGSPGGSIDEQKAPQLSQLSLRKASLPPNDTPSLLQRRQSFLPGSKTGLRSLPGNREMTLKMTLTRPDLRTESSTPTHSPTEDPLRLAALPPADRGQQIWNSDLNEQGAVRRIWHKLRRRL